MIECTFEHGGKGNLRHVTVGVIVLNQPKTHILLARRAEFLSEPNKLALPGGYLDRDETTIDAAIRETKEETGYSVTITSLFRIIDKPDRINEDKQNVEFTYLGEGGKQIQEPDHETTEVVWFKLDDFPFNEPIAFDHDESIELIIKYLQQPFSLPILK